MAGCPFQECVSTNIDVDVSPGAVLDPGAPVRQDVQAAHSSLVCRQGAHPVELRAAHLRRLGTLGLFRG